MEESVYVEVQEIRAQSSVEKPVKGPFGYVVHVTYVLADGREIPTHESFRLLREAKAFVGTLPKTPDWPTTVRLDTQERIAMVRRRIGIRVHVPEVEGLGAAPEPAVALPVQIPAGEGPLAIVMQACGATAIVRAPVDNEGHVAYEFLSESVGGWIESMPCAIGTITVFCNEEGKVNGLAPNTAANRLGAGALMDGDVVVGDVVVVGGVDDDGYNTGLTEDQVHQVLSVALDRAA